MKKILILVSFMLFVGNLYADEFEDALKACNRGSGFDCSVVALSYEMGMGTRKDKSKAFEYYKKSCDEKNALGCSSVAKYYEEGIGTEKNIKEAIRIHKFLCDYGMGGFSTNGCKKYQELTK